VIRRSRNARLAAAYAAVSSQLNMERASVVSTWRTTSLSKSSCVLKPLAANFFQASRWGSGIEAVGELRYQQRGPFAAAEQPELNCLGELENSHTLDTLDLASSKTSKGTLVLGSREARANRTLKINGGTGARTALSGHRGVRHLACRNRIVLVLGLEKMRRHKPRGWKG
jgi:hypothetical protein